MFFILLLCDVTSVVLQDTFLKVSRKLARLVSMHLMYLQLPKLLAGLQDCENRDDSSLCLLETIAHLLHVRPVELASAHHNCVHRYFLPRYWQNVPSQPLHTLMSDSNKFSLLMEHGTSSRFALIVQSISCALCNQLNRFLALRVGNKILYLPKNCSGLVWYRFETWNIPHEIALSLWKHYRCKMVMQHLLSREAAQGCRANENFKLHRLLLNPLSEQTFQPHQTRCLDHNLNLRCRKQREFNAQKKVTKNGHNMSKSWMCFWLHSVKASQQVMTWWNDFWIRPSNITVL